MALGRLAWAVLATLTVIVSCGDDDDHGSDGTGGSAAGTSGGAAARGGQGGRGGAGDSGAGAGNSDAGSTNVGGSTEAGGSTSTGGANGSTGETTGGRAATGGDDSGGSSALGGSAGVGLGGEGGFGGGTETGGSGGAGGEAGGTSELPSATITFPPKFSYTDASTLAVRGRTHPPRAIQRVLVNGVVATTTDGFASWSARVPIADGSNSIAVAITDSANNTVANAASVQVTNKGLVLSSSYTVRADPARGRVIANDSLERFLVIDSTTRRVSRLFESGPGAALRVETFRAWAIDGRHGRIVFSMPGGGLGALDMSTGLVTTISPHDSSSLLRLGDRSLCLDSRGEFAYTLADTLVEINLQTGARRNMLGRNGFSLGGGEGSMVYDDITNPTSPRVLIIALINIVAIDLATGAVTTFARPGWTENGNTNWIEPAAIALDGKRRKLLARMEQYSPLMPTSKSLLVSMSLDSGSVTTLDLAGALRDSPPFIGDITQRGDTLLLATKHGDLIDFDIDTGRATLFAGSPVGQGHRPRTSCGFTVLHEPAHAPQLRICEPGFATIIGVDLATASRADMGEIMLPGNTISRPTDMTFHPSPPARNRPTVFVWDDTVINNAPDFTEPGGVIAIDLATKERSVLSSISVGKGDILSSRKIEVDEPNQRLLVAGGAGLFAVDLRTGDRSTIVDFQTASGPYFGNVFGFTIDPRSPAVEAFVAGNLGGSTLLKVNLKTGDRVLVAQYEARDALWGLAFDASSGQLLALESNGGAVYSTNPSTGARTLISGTTLAGSARGTGPTLGAFPSRPESVEVDSIDSVAYVAGGASFGILAVDLSSGDRVFVSH